MTEFNRYRMYYYSAPQYSWDVRIDLRMTGGDNVGTLLFMKAGQTIPANTSVGGFTQIHYSISHFPAIMSMLREEQPLFLNLNTTNGIGTISTSDEPVGEQEGV
jgi:hypothetical protein